MSEEELMKGSVQIVEDISSAIEDHGIEVQSIGWKVPPSERPAADTYILVVVKPPDTYEVTFSRQDIQDYSSGIATQANSVIPGIIHQLKAV